MPIAQEAQEKIESTIKGCIRDKFDRYSPESKNMPFHYRLLGKDRLAIFSFIHSLNTSFGTSVFEPIAEALAKLNFPFSEKQYVVGSMISKAAQGEIQEIIDGLTTGNDPDTPYEIKRIREVCRKGEMSQVKSTKADLCVKSTKHSIHLFDIKAAKPNKGNFKEFKRTLLEWSAIVLADHPETDVNTCIAIPYNPYEPKPYERWTAKGMLDFRYELKVAEEFWNFLGGEDVYEDLLGCFERAGMELRPEIDEYFARFRD